MELPESPELHRHKTGHSWLDIIFAVSALFVSCISLFIAIRHGEVMEQLVSANQKMVEASSWPLIQFQTVIRPDRADISLENQGVGPAKLKSLSVTFKGQPVTTAAELLKACCASAIEKGEEVRLDAQSGRNQIIAAHQSVRWLALQSTPAQASLFQAFLSHAGQIRARACYCSVFEDCWLADSDSEKDPQPVKQCPAPSGSWEGVAAAQLAPGS